MIIKIVGFKVNVDRSTCYYKVDVPEPLTLDWGLRKGLDKTDKEFTKEIEQVIGHYMWLALKKSEFVSVRK